MIDKNYLYRYSSLLSIISDHIMDTLDIPGMDPDKPEKVIPYLNRFKECYNNLSKIHQYLRSLESPLPEIAYYHSELVDAVKVFVDGVEEVVKSVKVNQKPPDISISLDPDRLNEGFARKEQGKDLVFLATGKINQRLMELGY